LGCSGSVDGALKDGSVDRISVDDGGANRKRDEEEDLHSDGGEEKRVSQPQAGSCGGDVEVGGCHGPIVIEEVNCSIMLGNPSRGWGGGLNSDRLGCDWARPIRCAWCGVARLFRSVLKLHLCST
jgi:hypothetical protein